MKNLVIGGVGVLSAVLLYGMTLIAAAVYSLYLTAPDIGSYDPGLGVFGTALAEIGKVPLVISALLFIGGVFYLVKESRAASQHKPLKKVR